MSKQKDFYLSQEEIDRKEANAMFKLEEAKETVRKLENEVIELQNKVTSGLAKRDGKEYGDLFTGIADRRTIIKEIYKEYGSSNFS